jgi:succinate dehydrogenase / fumarate reductase cytochrome b subunit
MAFGKSVGLKGLGYRGGGPMLVWLFHRISGLGMILFVSMHVLMGFLALQLNNGAADKVNTIYKSWPFQLFIYSCVIFHTINGVRIITMDFWPKLLKYQREAIWLEWAIFLPIYGFVVYSTLRRVLAGG